MNTPNEFSNASNSVKIEDMELEELHCSIDIKEDPSVNEEGFSEEFEEGTEEIKTDHTENDINNVDHIVDIKEEISLIGKHTKVNSDKKTCEYNIGNNKTNSRNGTSKASKARIGKKALDCNIYDYKCTRIDLRPHNNEKPFECNLCDYKSALRAALKKHSRIHTGEKPFECCICDYKFTQKGTLKKHLRTHTGEKPFECNVCDFKSSWSDNLRIHLRTHTGEKPFECQICGQKFSHRGTLKQHSLKHTGEKMIECYHCDKKCSTKANLKFHLRSHTGEKQFECHICGCKYSTKGGLRTHNFRNHVVKKR